MLFMAKSALCIGIVTAVATGAAGGGDLRAAIESGGQEAVASLGSACTASRDCLEAGSRLASAAVGRPEGILEMPTHAGILRAAEVLAGRQRSTTSAVDNDRPHLNRRRARRVIAARD